ncbi:MAG: hypothetical protein AAGC86_06960 [Pseudomonadota bacterium]
MVEIRCIGCQKAMVLQGSKLLNRFGPRRKVREVQRSLKCEHCGLLGEIRIHFPDDAITHDRLARGVDVHGRWDEG